MQELASRMPDGHVAPVRSARRRPHIFAFAPNDWHGPWMNRQQLLSRLGARGWPVTYSTGALSVWDRGTGQLRSAPWFSTYDHSDGVRIERPGKALLRWQRVRRLDRHVVNRHAAALLRHAGAAPSESIAYIFHPSFHEYAEALRCRWVVYHAYDIFAQQPGWTEDLARREKALLARADLIPVSSAAVSAALKDADPDKVFVLPNAADSKAFVSGPRMPCPADLAKIPRPRIAYIGKVNRKVDFPMIEAVARSRPDWHWAIVGPIQDTGPGAAENDAQIASAYRACRQLPNVHFLGSKPPAALPAYAGHMDVNAICYRSDPGWWNAASPLKLHEYLATGLPVVSVELPEIREFGNVVTFVRGIEGWVSAIKAALRPQSADERERRRSVALANSWDDRVDALEQQLDAMTSAGDGSPASVTRSRLVPSR